MYDQKTPVSRSRFQRPSEIHSDQRNRLSPQFSRPYHDRPVRPNFIVELRYDFQRTSRQPEMEALVEKLKFRPQQKSTTSRCTDVAGTLYYEQWCETLETVVQLWEMKLDDKRVCVWPSLTCIVEVPSDKVELNDRLKVLFMEKLSELKSGDFADKWRLKLRHIDDDIKTLSHKLGRPQRLMDSDNLLRTREGLQVKWDLISKRLDEFENAISCIQNYLENGVNFEVGIIPVFRFKDEKIDWLRIYSLMMRECRRLDDGLPIYASRREILKQIYCQQVTVLIGETGSGKSTQLVQFLADSGFSDHESIVCTQPRKLAAISLSERVKEEICDDTSVAFYPTYSSFQKFDSKVVFMTDHCLLNCYMKDEKLSGISCIIIDEAHERSLNTDLLLALIKTVVCQRPCLRLIIMSATVDAEQFTDYFFGCSTLHVIGRNFPVDINYVPCEFEKTPTPKLMPSHVHDVLRIVAKINSTEEEGTILAFLTSQSEVEWACEKFQAPSAIALPLHGKLSYKDQHRIFPTYSGKRKVIFATNVAETSLTIPGVKYVVDSGMVKESRFDPATGMNALRVCRVSQSSANQRAGRAGRTEPGICYRLYTKNDFDSMLPHQEPEIRRSNLGLAVLKILSLGIKDVQKFDFVDAPCVKAIEMAITSLIQIGAISLQNDAYDLTAEGRKMVKLGIEPRLGKIILQSCRERLGREGLVLAAVMVNSSSIFCRVGTEVDKSKSDCLKVKFCHPDGDLFTLLAVYKEWDSLPLEKRNVWCWENSVNAKSLRRCQDTVEEMEDCLKNELNIIVPSYWRWNPQIRTEHDKILKNIILSALADNVAMYSGYDQLGYEVASPRKHVQLHPSCSLLNFRQRPSWVVFGEILSISNEYLVCVTACEFEYLSILSPIRYDFLSMDSQRLEKKILSGFGSLVLKRFSGKSDSNLHHLVTTIRATCVDERISVKVDFGQNAILMYATSRDMEKVCGLVNEVLKHEKKLLQNKCMEKCLYSAGPKALPPISLFGAGAEIRHLELEMRYLSVDIYHSNVNAFSDRELLGFLEDKTSGDICAVKKFFGLGADSEKEKWGRVTFLTPDAAKKAVDLIDLNEKFCGGLLKVVPSRNAGAGDFRMNSFPSVRAKISWPRCCSKGVAIIKCDPEEIDSLVNDFTNLIIGNRYVYCERRGNSVDRIVITGIDKSLSDHEVYQELTSATNKHILDCFLVRRNEVIDLPLVACEEAIRREISSFLPRRNMHGFLRVHVFPPETEDKFMTASITFDGSLHLEVAMFLEQIDGKTLPGFQLWQKVRCHRSFHSFVSCPIPVYHVIKKELDSLITQLKQRNGVECSLDRNDNGSYRVTISAIATKIVAELRKPLEQLMKGQTVHHPEITPNVLQILFSRDGILLMREIQQETGTHINFDKRNMVLRVFGSQRSIELAQKRLVNNLLSLHNNKQLEIQLCNGILPPDTMKRVVQHFGTDLRGLKEKVPEAEFVLKTRRHSIYIIGNQELKKKVEDIILDLFQTTTPRISVDSPCPICLCELEDPYILESCCHKFCRLCLLEQFDSALRNPGSFPLRCTKSGCGSHILISDMRCLLSVEKIEEVFRASLAAYVAGSNGAYRFCPSPDCPSVYRAAESGEFGAAFSCGACFVETCTRCHVEYHPDLSCEMYKEFKEDPDLSLKEWCRGKENVKICGSCGFTIEKVDGCNHVECRCGRHVCWVCLEVFESSEDCYEHLRLLHEWGD